MLGYLTNPNADLGFQNFHSGLHNPLFCSLSYCLFTCFPSCLGLGNNLFKAVCTNLAGFSEVISSLTPGMHILASKRERQHTIPFNTYMYWNVVKIKLQPKCLEKNQLQFKQSTNTWRNMFKTHKEKLKTRPCLITTEELLLPYNNWHKFKRDISLFVLFTTWGQNQDLGSKE